MSNNSLNKLSKIDELIKKHGKKGLGLLIMFKLVKSRLIDEINEEHYDEEIEINEDELNELCINKAKQIMEKKKDHPTEGDIKELLSRIFSGY